MTRLCWFAFYPSDFVGGVSSFLPDEISAYILALCEQWASGDLQAIPDDPIRLACIVRLSEFPQTVRNKFESIEIERRKYLRNKRLAKEWVKAKGEYEARVKGGKSSRAQAEQPTELPTEPVAEHPAQRPALPPTTQNSESITNSAEKWKTERRTHGSENGSRAKAARSPRPLPDEEFLTGLQAKPAYAGLNVRLVYSKMVAWCEVKGKQPTRARLVNWLNREDQPMTIKGQDRSARILESTERFINRSKKQ